MTQQFVDDNAVTVFVDDNGVVLWIDDNGIYLGTPPDPPISPSNIKASRHYPHHGT